MIQLAFSWHTLGAIVQGVMLILLAPGVLGLLRWLKAELVQRRRPLITIRHPYWDLIEAMKRPAVRPRTVSPLFVAIPLVLFLAYGSLAFMVPSLQQQVLLSVDLVAIVYMLGLARFAFSLAGMDIASPFSWMGSSREMFYQFNAEVGFAIFAAAVAVKEKTVAISRLVIQSDVVLSGGDVPSFVLLALTLGVVLIVEAGRIPVDNQETHYELTMGHKAIGLEYSGRDLALIEWAEMIKLTALLALFVALFLPFSPVWFMPLSDFWLGIGTALYFLLKLVVLVLILAIWETAQPKGRIRAVSTFALWSAVLGFFAIIYTLGSSQK